MKNNIFFSIILFTPFFSFANTKAELRYRAREAVAAIAPHIKPLSKITFHSLMQVFGFMGAGAGAQKIIFLTTNASNYRVIGQSKKMFFFEGCILLSTGMYAGIYSNKKSHDALNEYEQMKQARKEANSKILSAKFREILQTS